MREKKYVPLDTAAYYVDRLPMGDEPNDIWLVHHHLSSVESIELADDIRTVRQLADRRRYDLDDHIFRQAEQLLDALLSHGDKLSAEVNHALQKRLGLFVVRVAEEYEVMPEVTFTETGVVPKETNLRAADWYVDRALMTNEEQGALYDENL